LLWGYGSLLLLIQGRRRGLIYVLSISRIKPTPLLLWDPGHLFGVVTVVVMSDLFHAILLF
jgi:hypothetical protein